MTSGNHRDGALRGVKPIRVLATLIKLALASLLVGLVLSWLDVQPRDLYREARTVAEGAVGYATETAAWAWHYVLIGAAVVVPAWVLFYLARRLRGRG